MVKVVSGIGSRPEIVTLADLAGVGKGPAAMQVQGSAPVSVLQTASDAVNNIDRWISLADRGVSLFGQVDRILQRVQTIKGPGPAPAQAPAPEQYSRVPPGSIRVNADPVVMPEPELQRPEPVKPFEPTIPAGYEPPPAINVLQIAEALKMIDHMQPGVTCAELAESIKHNPAGVQKLVNVYLGGIK